MRLPDNYAAVDVETTDLNPWKGGRVFAAAASVSNGQNLFWREGFSGLEALLADPTIDKVFHNAKFDTRMLEKAGFKIRGKIWDTMIFAHLLDGRQLKGLGHLATKYLPSDKRKVVTEINNWFDEHKIAGKYRGKHFINLPPDILKRRNVGDAELTKLLFERFFVTVSVTFPVLLAQEHALVPVVRRMEDRGIRIDYDEIQKQYDYFTDIMQEATDFFEGILGWEGFNVNSYDHLTEVFDRCEILPEIKERTATGKYKLDDWNVRHIPHPAAQMLLVLKGVTKLRNTFLGQALDNAVNGILHPNFNQLGTLGSRFSCSKPNLQNIPIEGDRRTSFTEDEAEMSFEMTGIRYAPHLKKIFKVRDGYCHIHSDKKQAELCMLAHYTGDQKLIQIFNEGKSIHDELCRLLYGEWTKGLKTRTKAVVFGFMYGAGDETLAKKIGATISEARSTKRNLARRLPSLPQWRDRMAHEIAERGYIQTIHGRRYYIKEHESYTSVNAMCQGTVGDEVKSRMVEIDKWLATDQIGGTVLLNVHDDIATEVPLEERHRAAKEIHRIMHEASMPYKLVLSSSLDITYTSWSDLQEINDVSNLPEPPSHLVHRPINNRNRSGNNGRHKVGALAPSHR